MRQPAFQRLNRHRTSGKCSWLRRATASTRKPCAASVSARASQAAAGSIWHSGRHLLSCALPAVHIAG
jgi:hypothetical protein